jgi:hypothetical protein
MVVGFLHSCTPRGRPQQVLETCAQNVLLHPAQGSQAWMIDGHEVMLGVQWRGRDARVSGMAWMQSQVAALKAPDGHKERDCQAQ